MAATITNATIIPPKSWGDMAKVHVEYSDNTEDDLFKYFADELSFTADQFIGKTREQALAIRDKADAAYLRS